MDGQPDDTALMLRYGAGDADAFEVLYRRHNDALYRYLLRLCNNRDTAADLFQDAWSKVIRARSRYRPTARFNTWLYRIARNCFIDHLRRNKRYGDGPAEDPDTRATPAPGPDIGAEHAFAREKLLALLEALPVEQRDAFLLREEAGLPVGDIAAITGVGHETVKSRLRYATRKLRAAFDETTEPAA